MWIALACATAALDTGSNVIDDGPELADTGVPPTSETTRTAPPDTATSTTDTGSMPSDTAPPTTTPTDTGDVVGETAAPSPVALVVYATRHAEKWDTGADPGLTPEGVARAEALRDLLHDAPLDAVHATEWLRTQATAEPTAVDHGLAVITTFDPETELAPYLLALDPAPTVLSVGHSYTVSDFLVGLGVDEPPIIIDYGVLWTVTVHADGTVDMTETTYGE
jgi:hypothetical protein